MKTARFLRRFALIGLIAGLLGACGGGGGDGATGTPIADTAEAWWNQETSGRWAYKVTDTRPGYTASRVNLVTIGENPYPAVSQAFNFVHSSSLIDGQRMEELRWFDGRAIQSVLDPTTGESYAEIPAPLVADSPRVVYDQSEPFDWDRTASATARCACS